jgi:hypothetical protein
MVAMPSLALAPPMEPGLMIDIPTLEPEEELLLQEEVREEEVPQPVLTEEEEERILDEMATMPIQNIFDSDSYESCNQCNNNNITDPVNKKRRMSEGGYHLPALFSSDSSGTRYRSTLTISTTANTLDNASNQSSNSTARSNKENAPVSVDLDEDVEEDDKKKEDDEEQEDIPASGITASTIITTSLASDTAQFNLADLGIVINYNPEGVNMSDYVFQLLAEQGLNVSRAPSTRPPSPPAL